MTEDNEFQDRVLTQELRPGFLREFVGEGEEVLPRLREITLRLERSYNVVAEVKEGTQYETYNREERGYTIRVIRARDAGVDEIQRGMESIPYWLEHGDNDD